ncbi:hypothetical protein HKBW3S06_00524 [Candidatus Hakubella thermalkaliphila]|uniref:Uncharacterized protein n=1 Tax=Candidatus Hakubella thermalkaliphila TaxID=2754717 RepID=A0A6V8QB19_9ACTN|nr:hypothetical protein HKBW3S06_00524 [Candidatus Hakubella thermalkaliphila]GFP24882.1 hypothetical protein HKBW3S25_00320 [Candidatus Hakubella thermalkaliphila]GFP41982.1 hypothetical protein HKBW3C_01109 [Candidatus Hakubella thermalkaliphila]
MVLGGAWPALLDLDFVEFGWSKEKMIGCSALAGFPQVETRQLGTSYK